jgi:hypothetical protein
MLTVHPEYDLVTKTWFVPNLEYEAPTLAALQRQMGPQARIQDYYPLGLGIAARARHTENEVRLGRAVAPAARTPPRQHSYPAQRAHKHDHDAILDLWAAGHNSREIAEKLGGGLSSTVVGATVCRLRQLGDPRAIHRRTPQKEHHP